VRWEDNRESDRKNSICTMNIKSNWKSRVKRKLVRWRIPFFLALSCLSAAALDQRATLTCVDPLIKVFRGSTNLPVADQETDVAAGEYATFQFVFHAPVTVTNLQATVLGRVPSAQARFVGYLDMSSICQAESLDSSLLKGVPLAQKLKQRIHSERKLTATIGIASNKLIAKIASDHKKPDGLTVITDQEKVAFLRPLPVRTLYGVGKVTEQLLNEAGISLVSDLQDYGGDLRALVGSFGPKLKQFAFGADDRPLEIGDEIKRISGEETFLQDTDDRKLLRACLKEQARDISSRLKHRRIGAHTVQVTVRYSDFTTLTRQISVEEPITEDADIYRLGCFLLAKERLVSSPLRLLGLGVSSLREPGRQLVLL
jgi:nucleotidyltransferase/DNA polymerase involved in DNA repair